MLTSNFARAARLPGAVSIARFPPRWFKGPSYLKLAPSVLLLGAAKAGMPWAEYARRYQEEVLDWWDPWEVSDELKVAADCDEPILLCFEKAGEPCHRILVANWFMEAGIRCVEMEVVPK